MAGMSLNEMTRVQRVALINSLSSSSTRATGVPPIINSLAVIMIIVAAPDGFDDTNCVFSFHDITTHDTTQEAHT
jgi:hypothetical protein